MVVGGIEATATWQYSLDSGTTWLSGTASSFVVPGGTYTSGQILVRQTDLAGNVGVSTPYNTSLIVVTTLPTAPNAQLAHDTGISATDGITNDGTVLVSKVPAGSTWQYSVDGGKTWINGTGSSFVVPEGNHIVEVRSVDVAGNNSVPYIVGPITVDTTKPASPTVKLENDTGSDPNDGITSDGTILVSNVPTGSTWSYSTDGGKTWTPGSGSSFDLAPGVYPAGQVLVKATSVAGNDSANADAGALTILNEPPATPILTLVADTGFDANDGVTNNGTISVDSKGASWSYTLDGGKTWTAGTGNSFVLAEGKYDPSSKLVLVKSFNIAGETSPEVGLPKVITVDTTAPVAPSAALAVDTGASATDGVSYNGTIKINGLEPNAFVQYSTDNGATWNFANGTSFVLNEGVYAAGQVQVKTTDLAGNASPVTKLAALTIDVTAPNAATIKLANDTGISNTDGITSDGTISVTGVEAGATWQYSIDSGKTWLTGSGASFVLAEGKYPAGQVQVRVVDLAGNIAKAAVLPQVSIEKSTSAVATVSLANDTGLSNTDGITSDGTLNVSGVPTGSSWQYSLDNGKTWVAGSGYSFKLAEGNYPAGQVQVRVVDAAGNVGNSTSIKAIVVDTTAPTAATIKLATDTGVSASDGITSNGTINVTGLESGATWAYSIDSGKTWNVSTGTSFTLAEGKYAANQIQVKQTDVAGNTSPTSLITTPIVVDKTAPASATFNLAQDTGLSATDGVTNNGLVNVSGIEAGASWQYSIDAGKTWLNGTAANFMLNEGTYAAGQVQVRVQDVAGNVSLVTQNAQALVIDTTAPNPATLALANDTGISNTDGITSDGTINVTDVEAGATWQYSTDGGQTWKAGSNSSFVVANGTYEAGQIKVRVTDLAGNSKDSSMSKIVVSSTGPTGITAKITGITDDTGDKGDWVTTDHTLTISGTITRDLTTNEVVQISKDGKTWINATTTGKTWSAVDPTELATGKYNYQVRIADLAGNSTASSAQLVNVVDLQANNDIANILGYKNLPTPVSVNQSSGLISIAIQGFIFRADAATDSSAYTVGKGDVNNVVISSGSLGFGLQLSSLSLMIYKYNAATGNYEYYKEDPNFGASISIIGGISGGSSNQTLSEGKYIFSVKQNGLGAAFYLGGMSVKGTSQDYGQLVTKGNAITDGNADIHTGSVTVVNVSSSTGASTAVGQDTNYSTTIQGKYGVLKIAANGAYVYERDYTNSSAIGKVDTFTYTIKDQWGNTSNAKIYMQIGADGLVFDPNNPGDDASANITAVSDIYNTNNAIRMTQTKTVYSISDIDNKIISADSTADRGFIDFAGNAKGQTSVTSTSWFIFTATDVNYASVTVDANSVLNLNYTVSYSSGNVQLTVEKYVNGAWTTVSTGYNFNYNVSASSPAVISIYNYDNAATEYRIVMNTANVSNNATNAVYFDKSGLTNSSVKIGSYSFSSSDVSGNVTSNDKGGSYAKVSDVNGTSISSSGTTTVSSTTGLGKLIIAADGSYTYSAGSIKASDLGKIDVFNYTITAGKSVSSAQLVFHVTADGVIMSGGTSGTYTLNGTSGNDLFVSRGSNDEFNLNGGNDTIIYNLLNKNDATGGNGKDSINGFTVMKSTSWNTDIDFIDVKNLLSDQSPTAATIKNFISSVQVKNTTGGTDTVLLIDRDGTGTNYNPSELVTLKNVTTSVDELLQTHQLLY